MVFMGVLFVAAAALKLWFRSKFGKKRRVDPILDSGAWGAHSPEEPARIRPKAKIRADPLTAGWSPALLMEMEWHRFEHTVAAYESEMGHAAEVTGFGADGGIDVVVFAPGTRTPQRVIQCKAFTNQRVGVELVRAFYGAMTLQKIPQGAFYTTSRFTDDALAVGRSDSNLDLVDGPTLLNRIKQLPLSAQLRLFDVATEGDYTTPTCPSCGVKMVLRISSKGRSEGSDFYGCRNFPRCKQTFKLSQPD